MNTGSDDRCGSRGWTAGLGLAGKCGVSGRGGGMERTQGTVGGTRSLSIPFCYSNPTSSSKLFYCITKGVTMTPNICFTASYEGKLSSNIESLVQSMFLLVYF